MSANRLTRIQRFVYSHHFIGGIRRGAGVLLVFALGLLLPGAASQALIAALGALCVAIIDQPGPLALRLREMLGGLILGTLAVLLTGVASSHPAGYCGGGWAGVLFFHVCRLWQTRQHYWLGLLDSDRRHHAFVAYTRPGD